MAHQHLAVVQSIRFALPITISLIYIRDECMLLWLNGHVRVFFLLGAIQELVQELPSTPKAPIGSISVFKLQFLPADPKVILYLVNSFIGYHFNFNPPCAGS